MPTKQMPEGKSVENHKMKLQYKVIALIVLTVVALSAFGCNKGKEYDINTKKRYYQYFFNSNSEKYEKVNNYYEFASDGSFVFGYGSNGYTLAGRYEKAEGNYVNMSFDLTDSDEIIGMIRDDLGNSELSASDIRLLLSQINFDDTIFAYKDTVFSATNIQAYKYLSSEITDTSASDEIEGVYAVNGYEYLLYLSGGDVYSQSETTPIENDYPMYRASYKVIGDYIYLDFKESKESTRVTARAVYYIGMVQVPEGLVVSEEDEIVEKYLKSWSGLKVVCWTNSFYTYKEVG